MEYRFDGQNYILRLNKGELIVKSLKTFIKEKKINGGWITGLGGLTWAELGFYDLASEEYAWSKYEELLELTNLTGNIAWQDDEPALHLHATVSDASLHAVGGHLNEAEAAGTVEIFIHCWQSDERLERSKDSQTGLNLLSL